MIHIEDEEMGISYQDAGPWRSYHLSASGKNLEECLADAHIFEIDQDGGELGDFKLGDAPGEIFKRGVQMIERELIKEFNERVKESEATK